MSEAKRLSCFKEHFKTGDMIFHSPACNVQKARFIKPYRLMFVICLDINQPINLNPQRTELRGAQIPSMIIDPKHDKSNQNKLVHLEPDSRVARVENRRLMISVAKIST